MLHFLPHSALRIARTRKFSSVTDDHATTPTQDRGIVCLFVFSSVSLTVLRRNGNFEPGKRYLAATALRLIRNGVLIPSFTVPFSFLSGRVMSRHLAAGFLLRALPTLATSEETRVGKHAETAKHGSLRQTSEFARLFIGHAEGGACARLRASSGYLGAAQKQNTAQRGPGTAIRRRRRRRRFPSRPVAAEAQIGCVPAEKPGVPLLMARAR